MTYSVYLPNNQKFEDLEKNIELQIIEELEDEIDHEIDRQKKKAYNRRLSRMYDDMWSTGSFGLR